MTDTTTKGRRQKKNKAPAGAPPEPTAAEVAKARRHPLAGVPLLKVFVPPELLAPVITGATEDGAPAEQAKELSPHSLPGGKLRTASGPAARGWYGPRIQGAPSTTKQAEILNTGIIGAPTGVEGVVNGTDNLSSTMISHDAPTAYNATPRKLTSPNVLVLGTVGSGKSSFVKTVCVIRPLLLAKHRAVVFDKKDQGDEGEYSGVARQLGAEPLRFSPDGRGTRLNLLDPLIVQGSGLIGQMQLVNAVARIARDDKPATEWEENATQFALQRLFADKEGDRASTMADLLPYLGHVPTDLGYSAEAKERYHQAGISIQLGLKNLLTAYGDVFDGETSKDVDLAHKLTVFDVSQLPSDGPAIPTIMSIGHQWLLGRLMKERGWITNVVYEEGWHMIAGPSARLVKANQKLSRSLGISNVFVMHKGTDIPVGSEGYTVVQEAQTVYAYRQDRPEDARWVTDTFGLNPDAAETLMNLDPGHCVFKYGSNPATHMRHVRSAWETAVTNTDEGMAGGAAPAAL